MVEHVKVGTLTVAAGFRTVPRFNLEHRLFELAPSRVEFLAKILPSRDDSDQPWSNEINRETGTTSTLGDMFARSGHDESLARYSRVWLLPNHRFARSIALSRAT